MTMSRNAEELGNLHRNGPQYECVRNQFRVCNLGLCGHVSVYALCWLGY